MACDCGGPCMCTTKDGFTVPDANTLRCSLTRKLIPVVDRVRDLYTQLGARPYRVWIIRTRSSSERRGMGVEQVTHQLELLPTPMVVDMRGLSEQVTPIGTNEQGIVQLQYISGRYTEDILLGFGPDGSPVAANETVYYEIEFFRADGRPAVRRRFKLDSAPQYNSTQFQWLVTLTQANENRARDGAPEG